MATEPDASGGLGSFASDVLGILTGAAGTIAQSPVALGRLLNLGDLTATVDAQGRTQLAAAPAPEPSAAARASDMLKNPLFIVGALAVGALLFAALRR